MNLKKYFTLSLTIALLGCAPTLRDEVLPPTEQEMTERRTVIKPKSAMTDGIFHMKRVNDGTSVLVKPRYKLKRPDLPPFDVAYVGRDIESVLLELANAAGESIVIPQNLRGRTVTAIHSGASFPEMLTLVLSKVGYHWNYVDGVWYLTRYPVRQYQLEVGQGIRSGSLGSALEIGAAEDEDASSAVLGTGGTELGTNYEDEIWEQITETMEDLISVGADPEIDPQRQQQNQASGGGAQAGGGAGQQGSAPTISLLEPPSLDEEGEEGATAEATNPFEGATQTASGGIRPNTIERISGTDHLTAEEIAVPFFRVTRSAGLITVRAAPEAHRAIQDYLENLQKTIMRQIFVEVRIVAVVQDKETDRGTQLSQNVNLGDPFTQSVLGSIGFQADNRVVANEIGGGFFNLTSSNNDLTFIMQNLSKLGDVYTLSSPSLIARNNQISRVSLTRQIGYAETTVETNTTDTGAIVTGTRTDEAKFRNEGTILSVLPFIGRNKVQLQLRLSLASQVGTVDIATAVADDDPVINEVPELANNIIDQDMVAEFGRVYSIGGVIETSTNINREYMPGIAQIPGMSEIFNRAENSKRDTEFLVLLRLSRA